MSSGMSKKALMAALIVAGLGGSLEAAPLPGFTLAASTPRVSIYTRGGKVDARRIDQTVTRLEQTLGHRLSTPAEYYRYDSAQEVAAGTGHYAAGVTFPQQGQVHSIEPAHEHELVHLVAGQMGDPGRFFQEGLAVALGNGGRWQGKDVDRVAKGLTVSMSALRGRFEEYEPSFAYSAAGSFVGYLIKTHSVTKVAEFFRACTPGSDPAPAFARVFGRSIDEAGTAWQASL